ncbi:phosphonate ABC transporter ATP-binding protein [Craterilacuibacter sp.]|uniref:phosphonate ABC transporter ATP-binding protein n=1 Tax=Craterilacuibacter sp. TaxID=2870909 RepID=UPI003F3B44CB
MSLEFDSVSLRLGQTLVLDDIRLSVAQGGQLALIGPSGAGKSSLMQLANTAYVPTRGSVQLLNASPWQLSARQLKALRTRIGTIYQSPPLPARQRVVHAVRAGRLGQMSTLASLAQLLWPHQHQPVVDALAQVALADKLWMRCDQLSGGQRQRAGIARVLYQAPELLLADEPVSALDPHLAEQTVSLLCRDAHRRGATLLMSLHSVELALAHFERIVGLRGGRILFDLPRSQVSPALLDQLYRGDSATPLAPAPLSRAAAWPC